VFFRFSFVVLASSLIISALLIYVAYLPIFDCGFGIPMMVQ
jgi:hypothetical protein